MIEKKPDLFLGGLVGLFSGMSILSVIEILYWCFKLLQTFIMQKKSEMMPTTKHESGRSPNENDISDNDSDKWTKTD